MRYYLVELVLGKVPRLANSRRADKVIETLKLYDRHFPKKIHKLLQSHWFILRGNLDVQEGERLRPWEIAQCKFIKASTVQARKYVRNKQSEY